MRGDREKPGWVGSGTHHCVLTVFSRMCVECDQRPCSLLTLEHGHFTASPPKAASGVGSGLRSRAAKKPLALSVNPSPESSSQDLPDRGWV